MSRKFKLDFAVLESISTDGTPTATVEGANTPAGPIRLAIDAEGHRHVLVPLEPGSTVKSDRRSSGVQTGRLQFESPETGLESFLDLRCTKPHLHDIFELIANEIIDLILEDGRGPDRTASAVLERWRELLGRERIPAPSLDALLGIYGELWHLREIVRAGRQDILCWSGPAGAIHDFRVNEVALEVKTTRKRAGWRAEIHGVEQLLAPEGGKLFLSLIKVEVLATGGEAIPELIDALIALGVERVPLLEAVAGAGLPPEHFEACQTRRFEVHDHRCWEVGDRFPRLVPASFVQSALPLGVARVVYEIDLTSLALPPLDESSLTGLHASLAADAS